mgnify:FL=1
MKVLPLLCVFGLLLVGGCQAEKETDFYRNGQKAREHNFKDGKLHGLATE